MAVFISTAIVSFFTLDQSGVSIVGVIPKGLPVPALPDLDLTIATELLPAAFLISIVGFVESLSVGHTLAARRRERIQPNQGVNRSRCCKYRKRYWWRLASNRWIQPLSRQF